MSVTHVAGPTVSHNGRIIQRCAVCGEKLADNLGCASSDGTFCTWADAALVQVDGNQSTLIGSYFNDDPSDDFCIILVER